MTSSILEPITRNLANPEIGRFSVEKMLYNYQTDALEKTTQALYFYWVKIINGTLKSRRTQTMSASGVLQLYASIGKQIQKCTIDTVTFEDETTEKITPSIMTEEEKTAFYIANQTLFVVWGVIQS